MELFFEERAQDGHSFDGDGRVVLDGFKYCDRVQNEIEVGGVEQSRLVVFAVGVLHQEDHTGRNTMGKHRPKFRSPEVSE